MGYISMDISTFLDLYPGFYFGYTSCGPDYNMCCFTDIFFYVSIVTSGQRKQHGTPPRVETDN